MDSLCLLSMFAACTSFGRICRYARSLVEPLDPFTGKLLSAHTQSVNPIVSVCRVTILIATFCLTNKTGKNAPPSRVLCVGYARTHAQQSSRDATCSLLLGLCALTCQKLIHIHGNLWPHQCYCQSKVLIE